MSKDYVLSAITRVLLLMFGFAQGVIIARFLLPEGKGVIAVYLVSFNLVFSISSLGVRQSTSFFLAKKGRPLKDLSRAHAVLLPCVWLLSSLALLMTYSGQGLLNDFEVVGALLATIFCKLYVNYTNGFALGKREVAHFNMTQLLPAAMEFLLALLFVVVLSWGVPGYFFALFLSSLVTAVHVYLWARNLEGYSLAPSFPAFRVTGFDLVRKGVAYAVPLFVFGLNYNVDILILNHFLPVTEVGIYSQGVSLANLLWQVSTAVNLVVFSHSVTAGNAGEYSRALWRKMKKLMLFILPVALVIAGLSPHVVPWLYGEAFQKSATVIMLLAPGVYFMTAFKILHGDMAGRGRPLVALRIFTGAVVLNVILNVLLIPEYGIFGAAAASSLSYTYGSIHYLYEYHRICIGKESKLPNVAERPSAG